MRADVNRPLPRPSTRTPATLVTRAVLVAVVILAALALAPDAAQAGADDLGYCGGYGQRACCLNEAVPSCDSGLSETSAIGGWCGGILAAFPAGTCGGADPDNLSFCGGNGQRACCVGESPALNSCDGNNQEQPEAGGKCQYPAIRPGDDAGTCWTPTPCGGEGQRACSLLERIPSCNSDLVERGGCDDFACGPSSGWCYRPTPCGGDGQRACCAIIPFDDIGGTADPFACNEGLVPIPGASGDFSCGVGDFVGNGVNAIHTCAKPDSLTDIIDGSGSRRESPSRGSARRPHRGTRKLRAHRGTRRVRRGATTARLRRPPRPHVQPPRSRRRRHRGRAEP